MFEVISNDCLSTKSIDLMGIGKLVVKTSDKAKWNIPHLHYMVMKNGNNRFDSICLEFGEIAGGETEKLSIERMFMMISSIIDFVEKEQNFEYFLEMTDNHDMDDFWRVYRRTEFLLSQTKNNLSNRFEKTIKEEDKKKINEMVEEIKTQEMEIEELKFSSSFPISKLLHTVA